MGDNPVAKITKLHYSKDGDEYLWRVLDMWCPGCQCLHRVDLPPHLGERVRPDQATWEWDGNLERPTINPSILCHNSAHLCAHTYTLCPAEDGGECPESSHLVGYRLPDGSAIAPKSWEPVADGAVKALVHSSPHADPAWGPCHSFVVQGMWQFLGDCGHALAGYTVPMVPLPDWLVR